MPLMLLTFSCPKSCNTSQIVISYSNDLSQVVSSDPSKIEILILYYLTHNIKLPYREKTIISAR